MAIKYAPEIGQILLCDFDGIEPEMRKRRPVVVLATVSPRLCIVAPLSLTEPEEQKPWHYVINTPNSLPPPYDAKVRWLKGDVIAPVSFKRLTMPCKGKDKDGNRLYVKIRLDAGQMREIRKCAAAALGITALDFSSD